MKNLFSALILISLAFNASAQTDVTLKINHKLGTENFEYGAMGTNNLGHPFKAQRLEYYVSQITILHDGGMETAVPLDVLELVQPGEELSTLIPLGSYTLTDIESVRFFIGVHEPVNNEDPALYSETHPLGLKSPSMHWGWASGYRFVAYEGTSGADFSQSFQLHGLGNENYFEVASEVEVNEVDGVTVLSLNGNYSEGLRNLNLMAEIYSHGTTAEAKTALENWRDFVFGLYYVGLEEETQTLTWNVYPNPTTGIISIQLESVDDAETITIVNPLGEIVQTLAINKQTTLNVNLPTTGVYFVTAINKAGETIATERIIVE